MANESDSKSAWLDPRFLVTVLVMVAGAISSWAVFGERLGVQARQIEELKVRVTDVEKKIPDMVTINASLTKIDRSLEKLTDRFNEFLEGELRVR